MRMHARSIGRGGDTERISSKMVNSNSQLDRRDGRAAEGARLESVFRGNSNVGSNPTLSASDCRSFVRRTGLRISPAGSRSAHARITAQVRIPLSPPAFQVLRPPRRPNSGVQLHRRNNYYRDASLRRKKRAIDVIQRRGTPKTPDFQFTRLIHLHLAVSPSPDLEFCVAREHARPNSPSQ